MRVPNCLSVVELLLGQKNIGYQLCVVGRLAGIITSRASCVWSVDLQMEKKLHVGGGVATETKKGRAPSCVSRVDLQVGQR